MTSPSFSGIPSVHQQPLFSLETIPVVAPVCGFSCYLLLMRRWLAGVMSTLLQEIISVYPLLNPPELSSAASNRVCNALALLQCVASHPETRDVFLKGTPPPEKPSLPFPHRFPSSPSSAGGFNVNANILFLFSPHPPLPLPLPEHNLQIPALRVPPPNLPRRHRRPRKIRFPTHDRIPPLHRNNPPLSPHHGNGLRTLKNRRHFYSAESATG